MVAAILLAGLLFSPSPADRLNITTDAVTAQSAIETLSKESGVALKIQPRLANEIVVLRIQDAAAKDVFARFAEAMTAHWEPIDGGYRLVRSEKDLLPRKRTLRAQREKDIGIMLQKLERDLARAGTPTLANQIEWMKARDESFAPTDEKDSAPIELVRSPESRLIARLLLSLGAEKLAEDEDESVFATSPTRLQKTLPIEPWQWAAFVREHNDHAAAVDTEVQSNPETYAGWHLDKITRPFGKIVLRFQSSGPFGWASCGIYDSDGTMCQLGSLQLQSSEGLDDSGTQAQEGHPIVLPREAARFLALFTRDDRHEDVQVPPDLRQKLTHPDRFEPLSLVASKVVLALADKKKSNLIACLPDEATTLFGDSDGEGVTYESVMESLQSNVTRCNESDGWLIVSPEDPEWAIENRANRHALAKLVAATYKASGASLADHLDYAAASGTLEPTLTDLYLLLAANPDTCNSSGGEWAMLRFYATLAQPQRETLLRGAKLRFGDLSPMQQDRFLSCLGTLQNFYGASTAPEGREQKKQNDLLREPTEFLSRNPTPDDCIGLEVEKDVIYEVQEVEEGSRSFNERSLDYVALWTFAKRHPEFAEDYGGEIERIRPSNRQLLSFTFYIGQTECNSCLADVAQESATGYSLANLPSALKEELDKLVSDLEEQFKNGDLAPPVRFDQGNGGGPPPP